VLESSGNTGVNNGTNRVKRYTEELYKKPNDEQVLERLDVGQEDMEPEILLDEARHAISCLKNGKSPGVDDIPAELIKLAGESGARIMHKLCNIIWRTKRWPEKWAKAIFIFLPKSGDLRDCKNYRTISLLCHASKILLIIIHNRIKQQSERELPDEQTGFRQGRDTRDLLVTLQILIEKVNQLSEGELYLLFIDYSKAFDTVKQSVLFTTMMNMGIPRHLVALIQALYQQQTAAVRWDGVLSEWFRIGKGTRQGCNISPTEFNMYAEDIVRRTMEGEEDKIEEGSKHGVIVGGQIINNLRYADDTTLMDTTASGIDDIFAKLVQESKTSNMLIIAKKTNLMAVGRRSNRSVKILLEGDEIEQVEHFKFLGSTKTSNGDCTKEIKIRIAIAKEKATKLVKIWTSKNISQQLKVRFMKALIWPVFLYGAESWTIKISDINRIRSFEMWCWRKMMGVQWQEHRTDESILNQLGMHRVLMAKVAHMKFMYFGHVMRGSAGELALMVIEGAMEGNRPRGAPRKQWLDNIREWSGRTYLECKGLAQERTEWRSTSWQWLLSVAEPRQRIVP
jgi:hypothetical protein